MPFGVDHCSRSAINLAGEGGPHRPRPTQAGQHSLGFLQPQPGAMRLTSFTSRIEAVQASAPYGSSKMPERERLYCPCPPTGMVDVVGKKWALCVVTLLGRNGTLRYAPIQRALPRVSPATLTHTLRALEANGLVTRAPVTGDARAAGAYALTAQGEALYRSLLPLTSWLRKATPW